MAKRKNGNAPEIHRRNIEWFNRVCPPEIRRRAAENSQVVRILGRDFTPEEMQDRARKQVALQGLFSDYSWQNDRMY